MAIDKSRTSPFVKGVIIFVAVTFVLGIGGASIVPLLQTLTSPANTTTAGSTTPTDTVGAIAAKYSSATETNDQALKTDPKNYELLVGQANAYHDWAAEVAQATQKAPTGAERPLWLLAAGFYARALAVKPGDPNVSTDYSIAQFYSGDTAGAIATAEAVVKADAKFAPVRFNLAVFYVGAGDNTRGLAEYEAYVALAPTGDLTAEAKTRIESLKAASKATTATP